MNLIDGKQSGFVTKVDLEASFSTLEKPNKALLRPTVAPASSGVGWVPQIKSSLALPKPTKVRSEQSKKAWEKNLAKLMASPMPAPTYHTGNISSPIPIPPMPTSSPQQAMPPTPLAHLKLSFEGN